MYELSQYIVYTDFFYVKSYLTSTFDNQESNEINSPSTKSYTDFVIDFGGFGLGSLTSLTLLGTGRIEDT